MPNKIDSSATGLAYGREPTLKADPTKWNEMEPDSESEFGGKLSSIARDPINFSRQMKKSVITGLDVNGNIGMDMTQTNLIELLQGICFADAYESFDTNPLVGTSITITNVDGTNDEYEAASGLDTPKVNDLIFASGFTETANNGLKTVASVAAGALGVSEDLVDETPPSTARLVTVGHQFSSGDLNLNYANNLVTLSTTTKDLTELGLTIGQWIFVGGDSAGLKFVNNEPFKARVYSIDTNALVLDMSLGTHVTETGTGLTIQLFFSKCIKNENTAALIKPISYQFERQLGNDGNGIQSEYLKGMFANELQLNIESENKLTTEIRFIGLDTERRDGTTGIKSGTRISALNEDAYNTSSDVYSFIAYTYDDDAIGLIGSDSIFAYLSKGSLSINNNMKVNKAVGVLGGFDVTAGKFQVTANLEGYLTDFTAIESMYANYNVGSLLSMAHKNVGFVIDVPKSTFSDGRPVVEKGEAVKLPLDSAACESSLGHTISFSFFNYLPDAAMPA